MQVPKDRYFRDLKPIIELCKALHFGGGDVSRLHFFPTMRDLSQLLSTGSKATLMECGSTHGQRIIEIFKVPDVILSELVPDSNSRNDNQTQTRQHLNMFR
jgi:hypothetical protein